MEQDKKHNYKFAKMQRDKRVTSYKQLKRLPCNLRKKTIREARNANEIFTGRKRKQKHKMKRTKPSAESYQTYNDLVGTTQLELHKILSQCDLLTDIPYDITLEELKGEIARANGHEITIYVQRDGLSTLTVVLPKENTTIATLKKTIAAVAQIQQKREHRARCKERLKQERNEPNLMHQQVGADTLALLPTLLKQACDNNAGELVCSETLNGHKHRGNVSWRFLWRAYMLFNVDTNQPINDENGRVQLKDLGIKNATTLKFCHRVKYCGRKRQK